MLLKQVGKIGCFIILNKILQDILMTGQIFVNKPIFNPSNLLKRFMLTRVNSVYLGQYHGCWCPGSVRRQDISNHDIDYIEYVGPSRIRGSV